MKVLLYTPIYQSNVKASDIRWAPIFRSPESHDNLMRPSSPSLLSIGKIDETCLLQNMETGSGKSADIFFIRAHALAHPTFLQEDV